MGIKDITRQNRYFKMDIEGMEYEVIRNGGPQIRNVKNWIIEVHPGKITGLWRSRKCCFKMDLRSRSIKIKQVWGGD